MDDVARLQPKDRSDLFRAAAEKRGVTINIIEKDFWVCWVLRRLYTLKQPHHRIHFKGGTSLSKVFGVINRMSEDIDLVVDRGDLGFAQANDPIDPGLSNKVRQRIIREIKVCTQKFVAVELRPALDSTFAQALGSTAGSATWSTALADDDPDDQTILFRFPTIEHPSQYVRPTVRLELGARGNARPSVSGNVRPYAADMLPDQFSTPDTKIPSVVAAQRTFWEKATILHMLHHQPADKPMTPRMARHYYDTFRLAEHQLGREALNDTDLLAEVVEHKQRFFPCAWARYDLAMPGALCLAPAKHRFSILRQDYAVMAEEMMFDEVPEFDVMIEGLKQIESEINRK